MRLFCSCLFAGYSYRLCKAGPDGTITEASCQQMPLDFATNTTQIKYYDGSRQPFTIPARTTSVGTHPAGSQWRLNPIPMCNCDQGAYCQEEDAEWVEPEMFHRMLQEQVEGKECKAVTRAECGTDVGINTCLKCGSGATYDCEECCPGLHKVSKYGYTYCVLKPSPGKDTQFTPYAKTYLRPGQTSTACPTGLMFNASWDEGVGSGPHASGYGDMPYSMTDVVKVPNAVGRYVLSWRWDCEQTYVASDFSLFPSN